MFMNSHSREKHGKSPDDSNDKCCRKIKQGVVTE